MSSVAAPHVSPISTYLKVYGALVTLTAVTVGVSYLGLPSTPSIAAAMAVALTKAVVVALYFMHLKWDTPFNRFVFASSIFFLATFFVLTMFDLGTRGDVLEIQDNFILRADRAGDAR